MKEFLDENFFFSGARSLRTPRANRMQEVATYHSAKKKFQNLQKKFVANRREIFSRPILMVFRRETVSRRTFFANFENFFWPNDRLLLPVSGLPWVFLAISCEFTYRSLRKNFFRND